MPRRAKIVATLGPACFEEDVLHRLLQAGVDVVRLNLSHGDHESHHQAIQRVRRVSKDLGRFVPIIVDLMGPRYRLSEIVDGPRMLDEGQLVTLGTVDGVDLPVEDPYFFDHLKPGERLLIDNGMVELKVTGKDGHALQAKVLHGGLVSTRKGINLPDTDLPFSISDKDLEDIAFAVQEEADYIAVSFVGEPGDLTAIRAVMKRPRGPMPLIAKLERATVVKDRRLEKTIQAADAVMVARGDLGVELPPHRVPVMQKKIIGIGRQYGKPVIVATQMLESMMAQPRPTRAETSDVANAVFDGADALMLSGETAAGQFPVPAVQTMVRVICEAEAYRRPKEFSPEKGTFLLPGQSEETYLNPSRDLNLEIPEVVSEAAVHAARRLNADQIVAFSQGGFTARMIARYRPESPLTVFTRNPEVARRVQLVWGARPVLMDYPVNHHDEVVDIVDRMLVEHGLAKAQDTIVILMGDPIDQRPLTNLMRVHRVRGN